MTLTVETTRWWLQIQDGLAELGMEFVLITSNPPADPRLSTIQVPFYLDGFPAIVGQTNTPPILEQSLASALVDRDHHWLGTSEKDITPTRNGLGVCQSVLRDLLEALQPSVVLVWGSTLAQSVLLQQLAIQQGRPCWVIERGLLPDTLMIELAGQGGQSELNWSFNLMNAWRHAADNGLFDAAKARFCSTRSTKYAQAEYLDPAAFHLRHNPAHRKLVALMLQQDAGSGFVPDHYQGSRIHAPVFRSSLDTIIRLSPVARELNCTLIVKPHPNDKVDYSGYCNEHVCVTRDVNLHSLIAAADVVAVMTSSTQFEALLYGKPILLLGHSPLSNKGIAYEPTAPGELSSALKSALQQEGLAERDANAKRFLGFVLEHCSIALTTDVPAGSNLSDLCRFLRQNAAPNVSAPTGEDRLSAARSLLSEWSRGAASASCNTARTLPVPRRPKPVCFAGPYMLQTEAVQNRREFERLFQERLGPALLAQKQLVPSSKAPFTRTGFCAICGCEQVLRTDFLYASVDADGELQPSWRERQICRCGLNSRQRACFHILAEGLGLPLNAQIYCTEQLGALFPRVRERFPLTTGSEFLGDATPLGHTDNRGVRNEDLTRLTYPNDTFDCIMSLEVLEHIPDYRAALDELARCLKPGGQLLLTTPIHFKNDVTIVRAGFGPDGRLINHLPPVYHGDPINSGGALCFNDFGWDLVGDMRKAGFSNAALHFFTSAEYGYLGLHCVVLANKETRVERPALQSDAATAPRDAAPIHPPAEPTDNLRIRADALCEAGNWSEAGQIYQTLSSRLPDDLEVWRGCIKCFRNLGHKTVVDLIMSRALRQHPEWAQELESVSVSGGTSPHAEPIAGNQPAAISSPAPKASIIIPVLNKVAFTEKCLDALRRNTPAGTFEVIVWDNGSTDGTPEVLRQRSAAEAHIRYFRSETNLGFVGGNNAAAQHARGEYLVLLNNDTEPAPGWLEALVATVESDSSVGAVGAKLIYPDGKLQEAGGIIFRDGSGWNYGRTLDPRDPRFNFVREVDYCSAACLLVRAKLFRELGGFDARYAPAYYEDTDLCFSLRQQGYRVVYQPKCEVVHHEGATSGQDLTKGFKQYQVANKTKFTEKWKNALAHQLAPSGSAVRRASDRTQGQRLLIIDPTMPMYDRASGSKRLFEMLRLLTRSGNAVTFIARNGAGGERYAMELQQLGIEVYVGDPERMKECGFTIEGWPIDLQKLLHEGQYDTVILSFWYVAEQYLPRIRAWSPRSRVIIDTVDVHFLRERRQAELYHDSKLLEVAAKTRVRETQVYRRADALLTVTEDDRRTLLQELPQSEIFVLPNIHEIISDTPTPTGRQGCLFVGGFGHPPNEDAVLFFHREIWPLIRARIPDAHWTIVGNKPTPAVEALAGPNVTVTGYVPSTDTYLRSHAVSVAPLRYGAGMKGKIGEALAFGLPVVTTTTGAEGMGLQNGKAGTLVADDPAEFAEQVIRLMEDPILWSQLSMEGRQHIAANFTPECIARKLEAVLAWSSSYTSIIILAMNQWDHTERCLASIADHTPEPHEVIVVDNGSTDKTPRALRERMAKNPRLRVISNRENRGFSAGNNQGLSIARGDSVVLLNNDTIVTKGWLGRMRAVFGQHPEVGIVGPMSNNVSGPQCVKQVDYDSLATLPVFAERWATANCGQTFEVGRAVGFCLLVSRAVIDKIGGLDERFGSGNFEDDDFCLRAQLAGFHVRIARDAFIHHVGSQTFTGANIDYRQAMLRNWELFRAKWRLPSEVSPEQGYPVPKQLPSGVSLRVSVPALHLTHQILMEGRLSSDWGSVGNDRLIQLRSTANPAVAALGGIAEAENSLHNRNASDAWRRARGAIDLRPFHPPAYLLLAEIALEVGDAAAAKRCAQHARRIAPGFKPAKKFLKRDMKGSQNHDWLTLPDVLQASDSPLQPRLSVCLIAKNEGKFLGRCLASVKGLADQIIVVDTGSTDRTIEIAREHGAEVNAFTWCDDFSAARNAALEHATGDWVLVLDADEELPAASHEKLRAHLRDAAVMAWRLPIVDAGREDAGHSYVPRLFRNAPGVFFAGRVHEHAFGVIEQLRNAWGLDNRLGEAVIIHHGYSKAVTEDRDKVARNLRLLELALEESPNNVSLLMSLGLELCRSKRFDEGLLRYFEAFTLLAAQPAGTVVPELRETLLTQFASYLFSAKRHSDVVKILTSPLARQVKLTASQCYVLGMAQIEQQAYADATEQLRQCLARRSEQSLMPALPEVRSSAPRRALALCLWRLKELEAADKEFQQALAEEPQGASVHTEYARFLSDTGRLGDALQLLHKLVSDKPDLASVWSCGAQLTLSHPDLLDISLDWTSVAIQHHSDHLEIVGQRAEALMLAAQFDAALPLWQTLAAQDSPRAQAAIILCKAALQQSNTAGGLSPSADQEFARWFQRLVDFKAEPTIRLLISEADGISAVLPTAGNILKEIAKELAQTKSA